MRGQVSLRASCSAIASPATNDDDMGRLSHLIRQLLHLGKGNGHEDGVSRRGVADGGFTTFAGALRMKCTR